MTLDEGGDLRSEKGQGAAVAGFVPGKKRQKASKDINSKTIIAIQVVKRSMIKTFIHPSKAHFRPKIALLVGLPAAYLKSCSSCCCCVGGKSSKYMTMQHYITMYCRQRMENAFDLQGQLMSLLRSVIYVELLFSGTQTLYNSISI